MLNHSLLQETDKLSRLHVLFGTNLSIVDARIRELHI